MIGGIGLVMISQIRLHIRDLGELGRGQQLQIGGAFSGEEIRMLADRDVRRWSAI